jgi:hypothetical protein
MKQALRTAFAFAALVFPTLATAASCKVGVVPAVIDGAVAFKTQGLQVDADGAPNSYLVDGNGLSRTCDGALGIVAGKSVPPGRPHWQEICQNAWQRAQATGDYSQVDIFGFYVDPRTKAPVIQQVGDPLPGNGFVSTTSMSIEGSPESAQRHWVDATKVPYIVLSGALAHKYKINFGDLAVIYAPALAKSAFAVFADTNPTLGEASVKLHLDLGHNPIRSHSGVDRAELGLDGQVITLVFPGAHTHGVVDAAAWNQEIQSVGGAAFEKWGGIDKLKACSN